MAVPVTLEGVITEIGEVQFLGANKIAVQKIIFFADRAKDTFGLEIGVNGEWELTALGENVGRLQLAPNKLNKRCRVYFYCDSKREKAKEAGNSDMFFINNTLANYELLP
jgi:hypothetical protein